MFRKQNNIQLTAKLYIPSETKILFSLIKFNAYSAHANVLFIIRGKINGHGVYGQCKKCKGCMIK